MSLHEIIFFALHIIVFPAWALLFISPHGKFTNWFVHSIRIPMLMGAVYLALLVSALFFGQADPSAGMSSLGAVMALFSHPVGTLTGWSHFLVYDLFIGAWIARDAKALGFSHLATLPALVFSLMFGPIGLMIYLTQRTLIAKAGPSLK